MNNFLVISLTTLKTNIMALKRVTS